MLELKHLTVSYEQNLAVRDLACTLPSSGIVGIVGESGSGKTTLAHTLLSLLPPYAQVQGEAYFRGEKIAPLQEERAEELRGRSLGLIFQSAQNVLHPCYRTLGQAVEVLQKKLQVKREEAVERYLKEAKMLDLSTEVLRRYPHQLSGGMKQRAYTALLLALAPSLLIADEPTTALDLLVQAKVLKRLQEAQAEHQNLTLLISHDLLACLSIASELVIFYGGAIMEKGSKEALKNPRHPYTLHLFRSATLKEKVPELAPPALSGCPFYPSCPLREPICQSAPPPLEKKGGREVACYAVS